MPDYWAFKFVQTKLDKLNKEKKEILKKATVEAAEYLKG